MTVGSRLNSAGISMPSTFNGSAHDAVNKHLSRYMRLRELQWKSFASGWNAVAYRARAAAEYDEEFTRSVALSGSPEPEERFRQEQALFGFFVCALSSLECFFYSAYCIASIINDKAFPISTPENLRFKPEDVANKFADEFEGETISLRLGGCVRSPIYAELREIRNVLAHRGSLPRAFSEGGEQDGSVMMPSTPAALSTLWNYDFAVDMKTTSKRQQWVSRTLWHLLASAEQFCMSKL